MAVEQREPANVRTFVARLEQQLMTEADAQHRTAGRRHAANGITEAALTQGTRRDREGADTGEHHAIARRDPLGFVADDGVRT